MSFYTMQAIISAKSIAYISSPARKVCTRQAKDECNYILLYIRNYKAKIQLIKSRHLPHACLEHKQVPEPSIPGYITIYPIFAP